MCRNNSTRAGGPATLNELGGEGMTAHGFRTMASTLLNEQGVHPDLIELRLAHAERNTVGMLTTARSDYQNVER